MARLRFVSLPCLALLSTLLPAGCGDSTVTTVSASESSGGSSSSTEGEHSSTQPDPTTITPTTHPDPTTSSDTSSSSTEPVDPSSSSSTDPGTSSSSGTETGTSTGSSSDTDTDSSSGSSSGGLDCTPGQLNCDCDVGNCEGGSLCINDKCLPQGDGSCPFEFDGECDEGFFCDFGTDPADCCATPQDGNCEEFSKGGTCEDGTDFFDCGYCVYEFDFECDVPQYCPEGTDVADCCASQQDGNCEEQSQGGACPDGSDPYDCGTCLTEDDGSCDVPADCPVGIDANDCCATPENGVCEEQSQDGACPDGSDPYDCGFCPFEDDGECDVPLFCPPGSDLNDCA